MRGWAAFVLVLAGCDPLVTGDAPDAGARCPRTCAVSCDECLPSGYCASRTVPAGLAPIGDAAHEKIVVPGFPPAAAVHFDVRLGADVMGRDGQADPLADIVLLVSDQDATETRGLSGPGPDWTRHAGSLRAEDDGRVLLDVWAQQCRLHGDYATCAFDPASSVTVTLVSATPWQEPPPCASSPP